MAIRLFLSITNYVYVYVHICVCVCLPWKYFFSVMMAGGGSAENEHPGQAGSDVMLPHRWGRDRGVRQWGNRNGQAKFCVGTEVRCAILINPYIQYRYGPTIYRYSHWVICLIANLISMQTHHEEDLPEILIKHGNFHMPYNCYITIFLS